MAADIDLELLAPWQLFDSFSCCLFTYYRAKKEIENMTNQDSYLKHRLFASGRGLALASGQRSCSGSSYREVFGLLFTFRCSIVRIRIILRALRFLISLAWCQLVPISI